LVTRAPGVTAQLPEEERHNYSRDDLLICRYREIASILSRHGLGWVVLELGLGDLIPFHRGLLWSIWRSR